MGITAPLPYRTCRLDLNGAVRLLKSLNPLRRHGKPCENQFQTMIKAADLDKVHQTPAKREEKLLSFPKFHEPLRHVLQTMATRIYYGLLRAQTCFKMA